MMPGMLLSGASCRISVKPDSYEMYRASATKHQPHELQSVSLQSFTPGWIQILAEPPKQSGPVPDETGFVDDPVAPY
jgi:hypothetical protein